MHDGDHADLVANFDEDDDVWKPRDENASRRNVRRGAGEPAAEAWRLGELRETRSQGVEKLVAEAASPRVVPFCGAANLGDRLAIKADKRLSTTTRNLRRPLGVRS